MLTDDPIVSRYPDFLPSDQEISLAWEILQCPENENLLQELTHNVSIGGCAHSTLRRFCWQARQERKVGHECAEGAVDWLRRCVHSRERFAMDSLLQFGVFPVEFRDLYVATIPFSFHGTDKQGHPVLIFRYGSVDIAAFQHLWSEGEALRESAGLAVNGAVLFHLRAMEYVTRVRMAEETNRQGRVVDRMLVIMDLGGVSVKHYDDSLRSFLTGISQESLPLWPETLHATIVVNVPWLVSRVVWPVASSFMQPVTQAKFSVLSSATEIRARLLDFLEEEDIPPYLGGCCTCTECSSGQLRGGLMHIWEKEAEQRMQQGQVHEQLEQEEEESQRSVGILASARVEAIPEASDLESSCEGYVAAVTETASEATTQAEINESTLAEDIAAAETLASTPLSDYKRSLAKSETNLGA